MRKLRTTLGLALLWCMAAAPSVSFAEPKVGDTFGMRAGILCDTGEQLATIVKAGATTFEGAQAKYKELKDQLNGRKEPVCWFGRWALNTPITSVQVLPDFYGVQGFSHAWSVGLQNDGLTGFLLWEEPVAVQPSSMPPKGRIGNFRYIILEGAPPLSAWYDLFL